jgi:hypothetical protein
MLAKRKQVHSADFISGSGVLSICPQRFPRKAELARCSSPATMLARDSSRRHGRGAEFKIFAPPDDAGKSCLWLRYSAQLLQNAQSIPGSPDFCNFSINEVKEQNLCVEEFLARRRHSTGGDLKAAGVRTPKRNAGCDRISFLDHLVNLTLIVRERSAPDMHKLCEVLRAKWPCQRAGMSDVIIRDVLPELIDL